MCIYRPLTHPGSPKILASIGAQKMLISISVRVYLELYISIALSTLSQRFLSSSTLS